MTDLLYMSQPDLFSGQATIIKTGTTSRGDYIVLDSTLFYVQGGGQPSDIGSIIIKGAKFIVEKVVREDDEIRHYVSSKLEDLVAGTVADLEVNKEQRKIHSKLHSAGHLIDVAVESNRLPLEAGKGHHYPDGSYVEYTIQNDNLDYDKESLKTLLQHSIDQLIKKDLPMEITFLPEDKHGRSCHVAFRNTKGCLCGGTHVTSSQDLAGLTIKKIKIKKNIMKISYYMDK